LRADRTRENVIGGRERLRRSAGNEFDHAAFVPKVAFVRGSRSHSQRNVQARAIRGRRGELRLVTKINETGPGLDRIVVAACYSLVADEQAIVVHHGSAELQATFHE
jgi:hypothetical protein